MGREVHTFGMKHTYLAAGLIFVVFIGVLLFTHYDRDGAERIADTGAYSYICNGSSGFTLIPAADMSYLDLNNVPSAPAKLRVTRTDPQSGEAARYEGGGVTLVGIGESVKIMHGESDFDCSPVQNPDEAPFNWGDPEEGAGSSQNASTAVQTNIIGLWQSRDDVHFSREFKSDGTVVDTYDSAEQSSETGTWKPFDSKTVPSAPFEMSPGVVYVQVVMGGDTLDFSIDMLTPEALEMTYMARGNKLAFKRVQ